jgi:hypothetical protein
VPDQPSFRPHDEHLDQGDILSNVPFVKWKDGTVTLGGGARGIITSDGCACEDYERAIAAGRTQAAAKIMLRVAPLRPVKGLPDNRAEEIRTGKHLDYFYVHGVPPILPDHFVDLSREQPVPAETLVGCPKIARLADWQWRGLLVHFAVSRFHQPPEELFRPDLLEEG